MELHVQRKYFEYILSWDKIYEWRLAKDKYRVAKIGEPVLFRTTWVDEIIEKKITSIHIYWSFEEAWNHLWVNNILPWISDIWKMVNVYREFYSEEDENKYNVIMIGIS